MKKTSDFDFLNLPTHIIDELENPDWKTGQRIYQVYNWKYHVDLDFVKRWKQLSFREKSLVAYFVNQQAEQVYEQD